MSHVDQVTALSSALGVSLRKVTRPEVFELVRGLLDQLDLLGIEEKLDAWGYGLDDLCEVDGDGRISALAIEANVDIPAEILKSLEAVTLLAITKLTIGESEARLLAGWARLEHLAANIDPQSANAAIAHL